MSHEPKSQEIHRSTIWGDNQAETLLWVGLVGLAAALRLVDLAGAPLTAAEASQALAAYVTSRGAGVAVEGPPLLYHLNTLLFALFDGGDGLARLVPALAGTGLILTPLLLRRYLGRWGTLGAGLLLALSPTAVLASRTLNGTMLASVGVMVMVGAVARFLETYRPRWILFSGLGLAAALTAGPASWGLLLGLLLALAVGLWIWRDELGWILPVVRPLAGRWLLAAGAGAVLLGSGLLLIPAGLAATGEQFLIWWLGFRPAAGLPLVSPLTLLVTYEPLILLVGLVGLVLALRRLHGLGMLFTFWTAVGWVQLALRAGRAPLDLLWILLPLAVLCGLAVQALVEALIAHGHWMNEGLHLLISLVLWAHFGLTLARYTQDGEQVNLILAGLVVVLQLLLLAAFGFAVAGPEAGEPEEALRRGVRASLRAGGLSLGVVLLASALATTWGVTHFRSTEPRELLLQEPTAREIRLFTETVEQVSLLNSGALTGLPITSLGEPDPVVAWTLRHHTVEVVETEPRDRPPLVVAPADMRVSTG
ncbi:MAG: glycosyltransferase family 39 protein, partial [Anaerolineae bacterium]